MGIYGAGNGGINEIDFVIPSCEAWQAFGFGIEQVFGRRVCQVGIDTDAREYLHCSQQCRRMELNEIGVVINSEPRDVARCFMIV